jgi:hypothetical protein
MQKHPDSKIIDLLGGTRVVAALCEVTASSVCEWRERGIPAGWRAYLQQIRPVAFGLTRAPAPPTVRPAARRGRRPASSIPAAASASA